MNKTVVSELIVDSKLFYTLSSVTDFTVTCSEGEYSCLISKTCIPNHLRCNDQFDCELKEDELDCCK